MKTTSKALMGVILLTLTILTGCDELEESKNEGARVSIPDEGTEEKVESSGEAQASPAFDDAAAFAMARKAGFTTYRDVEVEPGVFTRIFFGLKSSAKKRAYKRKQSGYWEWDSLGVPTKQGMMVWEGPEIPVVMRRKGGEYFYITYNRETHKKDYYSYYRSEGLKFRKIKSVDFPKELVTQNMWLDTKKYQVNGVWVSNVDLNLEMNPDNLFFITETVTSKIWGCLLTGKEAWELSRTTKEQCKEYMRLYQVSKLTKLVK